MGEILIGVFLVGGYILPCIVCILRKKKHNTNVVALVNLFFGWSCIGWIIALIWAFADDPPGYHQHQGHNKPYEDDAKPPNYYDDV